MKNISFCYALAALTFSPSLLLANEVDTSQHAVVHEMVSLFDVHGTIQGPCRNSLVNYYSRIAVEMDVEVSFATKDDVAQTCRMEFFNFGEKDRVDIPEGMMHASLSDHNARYIEKIHSHPMRSSFFIQGEPYDYELMFSDDQVVANRQLPADVYEQTVKAVKAKKIPGFSFSPPSMQDLKLATNVYQYVQPTREIQSRVITSGGVWTYGFKSGEDIKLARVKLDDLISYATMHMYATSPKSKPASKAKASFYFSNIMKDHEWAPIIRSFGEATYELRAPYTIDAVKAYLDNGDTTQIKEQYFRKVEYAKQFCEVLKTMGVDISFQAFGIPELQVSSR